MAPMDVQLTGIDAATAALRCCASLFVLAITLASAASASACVIVPASLFSAMATRSVATTFAKSPWENRDRTAFWHRAAPT